MFLFTSPHRKYAIYGKEHKVKFTPIGAIGTFQTEDEQLAKFLRSHPEYGKKFVENGTMKKQDSNIISGVRSAATQPVLSNDKLIRFGELKASLLKSDGSYRKDAKEELKTEYENLKEELGV